MQYLNLDRSATTLADLVGRKSEEEGRKTSRRQALVSVAGPDGRRVCLVTIEEVEGQG